MPETKDNMEEQKQEEVKKEKSAGAIVYYIEKGEPRFLFLKYKTYWGFAKGIIEPEESIEEAAKREVREETSLNDFEVMPKFRHVQKWFYKFEGRLVSKEAVFLLAKTTPEQAKNVKISFEHEDFKWLGYDEALKYLKIKDNREMLKSACNFIKEYERQKKLFYF